MIVDVFVVFGNLNINAGTKKVKGKGGEREDDAKPSGYCWVFFSSIWHVSLSLTRRSSSWWRSVLLYKTILTRFIYFIFYMTAELSWGIEILLLKLIFFICNAQKQMELKQIPCHIQHLITLSLEWVRDEDFKRDPTQIIIGEEQAVKKNNNKTCSSFSSIIVWAFFPFSSSSYSSLLLIIIIIIPLVVPWILIKFYVDFLDSFFSLLLLLHSRTHSAPFLMIFFFLPSLCKKFCLFKYLML